MYLRRNSSGDVRLRSVSRFIIFILIPQPVQTRRERRAELGENELWYLAHPSEGADTFRIIILVHAVFMIA